MAFQTSSRPSLPYTKQHCDSYFVESHDNSLFGSRSATREHAKILARQRQGDLANDLSRLVCDQYMEDIMDHMRQMEDETIPDAAAIDLQEEIQWFMRPYLLDFLIEAHAFFQLLPETLFLAINLLDRYCSRRVVYKRHYQLVGCASLLIAAKYGDRKERVPTIKELKSMCCSLYDEEMFLQMEWHVLNTLEWVIGHPTVDSYLRILLAEDFDFEDQEVEHMSWYICELALYHKEFISTKASTMACASLALARGILSRPDSQQLTHVESVTVLDLSQHLRSPSSVLSRKYATPQFSSVSTRLEDFLIQQASIERHMPPTPPCEITRKPAATVDYIYNTPQKSHLNIAHGYMTPPITPDGEFFTRETKRFHDYPHRPITPTPVSNNPYGQYYNVDHSQMMQ